MSEGLPLLCGVGEPPSGSLLSQAPQPVKRIHPVTRSQGKAREGSGADPSPAALWEGSYREFWGCKATTYTPACATFCQGAESSLRGSFNPLPPSPPRSQLLGAAAAPLSSPKVLPLP